MDHQPIAEWLPERYRNVLDRISELEGAGRHGDADRIRRAAIRAYSRRWNEGTADRLDGLAASARRILATPVHPPTRWSPTAIIVRRSRAATAPVLGFEQPTS